MGTRADFYVGRGPNAEWLGSIAYDGYPEGHPKVLDGITDEKEFRDTVEKVISSRKDGTKPDQGWPWPWKNSNTTDFSYAFDEGQVLGTCFGHGWWPFSEGDSDQEEDVPKIPDEQWPDMESRRNVATPGDDRSGMMAFWR